MLDGADIASLPKSMAETACWTAPKIVIIRKIHPRWIIGR